VLPHSARCGATKIIEETPRAKVNLLNSWKHFIAGPAEQESGADWRAVELHPAEVQRFQGELYRKLTGSASVINLVGLGFGRWLSLAIAFG
jgi:hypothetical protein